MKKLLVSRLFCVLAVLVLVLPVYAHETATVTRVVDGDTLMVRCKGGEGIQRRDSQGGIRQLYDYPSQHQVSGDPLKSMPGGERKQTRPLERLNVSFL